MAIALNNTIQIIRYRIANGSVGRFFSWWTEELRNAMPSELRTRMQYARRKLLMQVSDGELVFSIDNAKSVQSLDSVPIDQDSQLQTQQIRDLIQRHELAEVSRDLLLSEEVVLHTNVVMPLAAEANLRQALAYEMDRHTPFSADDVFFTWRNLNRDREAGQLHFDLYVTPREPVESQIEQLKRLGLSPTGVDVATSEGTMGINLLPEALRYHIVNKQVRLNWAIAAVAVFLMIFVMAQSLWLREHQLAVIGKAIENVRAEAMAVQQVRQQIDDATEAAGFLQNRKVENGYKVEMLAELTRILPDNTFLDRLSMNEGTTQMQGKSGNAQSLIELINNSPQFENASFRGPTRLDNRSGKEIFDLSADNSTKDAD
ncbi:MAG: PilN domain-containing protein [Xanthomonadales bacterium]|nr:PilN domain-containing protein [Xanthomonadales bacterium]